MGDHLSLETEAMRMTLAVWGGALALLPTGEAVRADPVRLQEPSGNLSLRLEIDHHLDRGTSWLRERQDQTGGSWGQNRRLEMTGLVLATLMGNGGAAGGGADLDRAQERGFAFLMQGLAVEGERRSQVVPGVVWLQALPALFFRAEQPKIRVLIREGIDRLREESFPAWEEEFQRLEVLQTARMLNVVDPASIFLSGEERLAAPVTASRIRYLQGVMLSWGGDRRAAEREAWRTWAKAGFAEHLKSTDVRLHEAMAKGLAAGHVDRVRDARGGEVDWREKLAVRLFDLQRSDGSWTGEIPRVEGLDEVLENSCRALLALETIVKSL